MTSDILIAVYDGLADWEIGYVTAGLNTPAFQLTPGRFRVRTVGENLNPITTMGGLTVVPDVALADADIDGAALLVLPGADSWLEGANTAFSAAAVSRLDNGKPVAAICGATVGLAAAGALDTRDHTGNAPEQLAIAASYAGQERFRTERAVSDQGLITAGAASPLEFAVEVFRTLDVYAPDVLDAWYQLNATGDPKWFFRLMEIAA
ncbi:ThiJ/PfpI domain protein [Alloactinosynnema sp. L-07]|uniref:DJ-1/PfpI family protein n=1 Tax=Alloactinosynnema sp. L-07 TaxID=1653480 RepID=UPI00065F04EC|nr:DJ-1/PfpI family protein [Alloactinosynnema sp. L-07]CRK56451.1 ThiJ/PfpI domain protein [Alloactinosynnema sp. L-07]